MVVLSDMSLCACCSGGAGDPRRGGAGGVTGEAGRSIDRATFARMRRFLMMTGVAIAAAGCNFESGGASAGATDTDAAMDADATSGATAPSDTAGETTGPGTGETGEVAANYCHGFQAVAEAPFLSLYILGGEVLEDGALWPIECGSEGQWMFGLYPSLGGWDPMASDVTFMVEVDVEGFNTDEAGHFFSGAVDYHIGCEDPFAGLLGVAPVFPPDSVTELMQLDGRTAEVRVTVLAGAMELTAEASVTLSAPSDVVLQGCPSP